MPKADSHTTPAIVTFERCRILTAILLQHPKILPSVADAYESLALPAQFDEIRQSITRRSGKGRLRYKVREDVGQIVDQLLRQSPVPLPRAIASRKRAERVWWLMFSMLPKRPGPGNSIAARGFPRSNDNANDCRSHHHQ